jgi:hypothetical protein
LAVDIRRAVERTVPFGLSCCSVTVWYALHGQCVDDVVSHRGPTSNSPIPSGQQSPAATPGRARSGLAFTRDGGVGTGARSGRLPA